MKLQNLGSNKTAVEIGEKTVYFWNYIFNSLDKPEGVNYLVYIEQRR